MRDSFWTDERIKRLKTLKAEGLSGEEVAMKLGCTRNAVIGKWHRIKGYKSAEHVRRHVAGVKADPEATRKRRREVGTQGAMAQRIKIMKPSKQTNRGTGGVRLDERIKQLRTLSAQMAQAVAPVVAPPNGQAANAAGVFLLELENHHCRWPISEAMGIDTRFCAAERVPGKSYCQAHFDRSVGRQPKTDKPFIIRKKKAA